MRVRSGVVGAGGQCWLENAERVENFNRFRVISGRDEGTEVRGGKSQLGWVEMPGYVAAGVDLGRRGRWMSVGIGCVSFSPAFQAGLGVDSVAARECHSGRGALRPVPGRASPGQGVPRRLWGGSECEAGGTSRQCRAGPTAKGLRGRSAWRAALHSRPSRSRGNLLLEKWAGGGDDYGGPSLASARASRRPSHSRDILRQGPFLGSFD